MAEQPAVEVCHADAKSAPLASAATHPAGLQLPAVDGAADRALATPNLPRRLRDRQVLDREARLVAAGRQVQPKLFVIHSVTSANRRRARGREPDTDLTPPLSLSREEPMTPPPDCARLD